MNIFYIILLFAVIYFIVSFVLVARSRNKFKIEILSFIFQILILLGSFLFSCYSKHAFTRRFFFDTYLISIVWFLFFYSYFLQNLTNYTNPLLIKAGKKNKKLVKLQKIVVAFLGIANTIYVYLDLIFQYLYKPLPQVSGSHLFEYIKPEYSPLFLIYICIYSVFLSNIILMTVRKIFGSTQFYRKIYISLMLTIIILGFFDFVLLSDFSFPDITPIFYIYTCMSFTLYIFMQFPKDYRDYLITEVSDDIDSAIACFDFERNCIYTNQQADKIFGQDGNPNERIAQYLATSWIHDFIESNSESVTGSDSFTIDGIKYYFFVTYKKILDKHNKVIGSFLRLEDRTKENEKIERTKYKLIYDELTGLYNRHTFFEKCEELLAKEPDVPRYMVATNIKNFKLLNDLFGSRLGDSVLKKQAEMLSQANYADTICGRISSDKFGLFIKVSDFNPELAEKNTAKVEAITKSLNYRLKVYIGVYELMLQNESAVSMYDKALLAIKNIHGDYEKTLAFYDLTMMEGLLKEKNILSEFPRALRSNELKMYLQPLSDKKGNSKCAEALVRWQHPLIGTLSPNYFLETIEKTSYIYTLDLFMWTQAVQKLKEWQENGHEDWSISVNISPKDFLYADLYITFTDLIEQYKVSPSRLRLEITETAFMTNIESTMEVVNSLKEYGFIIEIDDFGSGYSSLNMLKELNTDVIKVDMAFLEETINKERSQTIMKSIISMAKDLDMNVISEGVETKEQLTFLSKVGCKQFQGYYFAKPMPVEDFEKKYLGGNDE